MTQPDMDKRARYRITFGKHGVLRYTSHLDVARLWERVLRRAGVPVIYSQGFNPRPQLQLAAALPLGCTSRAEVLDVFMEADEIPSPPVVMLAVQEKAPEGLEVYDIVEVDYREPALQSLRRAASYRVVPGDDITANELQNRIDQLLAKNEIIRTRRKKTYDLRPLILRLDVISDSPLTLETQLVSSQQDGTGRVDELLKALALDPLMADVERINLSFNEVPST